MDDDQEQSSSIDESGILEEDDIDSEDSDIDINASITCFKKISPETLKRQPLHEILQKATEESYSNFDKEEEAELQSVPRGFSNSSKSYNWPLLCLGILVGLAAIFFLASVAKQPVAFPNKQLDVSKLMKELKMRFDGLPSLTYRIIESAIKRGSLTNSDSPGIIVLISSKEAKKTAHELAKALVKLVSEPFDYVLIDANTSLSTMHLKKEIDVTIRANLSDNQIRAVLVRNLDELPFEAAMIFHSYCDHENAPFKRVIYVMTALVDEMISPDSDSKHWDILASNRLRTVWSDSGEDQVASLISRLTVSVAAVVPA